MGTRFVCTREAPVHPAIKQALVDASERDTRLMFRTLKNTARVFANAIADEVVSLERRGAGFDALRPLVAGARGKAALASGEIDSGVVWAGQVIGLIDDIPSCAALLERMVAECKVSLATACDVFTA